MHIPMVNPTSVVTHVTRGELHLALPEGRESVTVHQKTIFDDMHDSPASVEVTFEKSGEFTTPWALDKGAQAGFWGRPGVAEAMGALFGGRVPEWLSWSRSAFTLDTLADMGSYAVEQSPKGILSLGSVASFVATHLRLNAILWHTSTGANMPIEEAWSGAPHQLNELRDVLHEEFGFKALKEAV